LGFPRTRPEDIALIEGSAYFDADWYSAAYGDVSILGMSPAEHYLRLGARLGRHPSASFDARRYEARYPPATAIEGGALLHYLRIGEKKGFRVEPVQIRPGPRAPDTRSICVGWHMDAWLRDTLAAALLRPVSEKYREDARVIWPHFDPEFYFIRNPDAARSDLHPVEHYLRTGADRGCDPSPNFSTTLYKDRFGKHIPDGVTPFVHWCRAGQPRDRFADPAPRFPFIARAIGLEPAKAVTGLAARRSALIARLTRGRLGEMVARAAEIDPLVANAWPEAQTPKMPPFHTKATADKLLAQSKLHSAAEHRRARFVIAVNRARWGSGRKEEGYLAAALTETCGRDAVIVLYTDATAPEVAGRFDTDLRQVDVSAALSGLPEAQRAEIFVSFLRSLRAEIVFNINSFLTWESQLAYPQVFSRELRLFNFLFCSEKNHLGAWVGYPVRYFYRSFDIAEQTLVDSAALRAELITRHALPPAFAERIRVVSAPVDDRIPIVRRKRVRDESDARPRPEVFWAGRLDRQKRPDILLRIARDMPDVRFRVWGRALLDRFDAAAIALPNVTFEGTYESFLDLPLDRCDAWLYTSEWDGVPHVLLEMCMTGIPIVGALVGGTGEVLHDDLSWPVARFDAHDDYVDALREVLEDPEAARAKALALRKRLASQRNGAGLTRLVGELVKTSGGEDG